MHANHEVTLLLDSYKQALKKPPPAESKVVVPTKCPFNVKKGSVQITAYDEQSVLISMTLDSEVRA